MSEGLRAILVSPEGDPHRESLEPRLQAAGFRVVPAESLDQALRLADRDDATAISIILRSTDARQLRARAVESEAARRAGEVRIAELEAEAHVLQRFAPGASADARLGPEEPLSQTEPEFFAELVAEYGRLLERALEQRAYRVEHRAEITGGVRLLADRIGEHRGGPRDVVEIHALALRRRGDDSPQRIHSLADEGRLLLLEWMGYLISYYRRRAAGTRVASGSD